ncbi:MAG: cytochrome c biogenesis protein CcdA [Candidatus Omnitrophica bacterium]|nr:cytochrome c biogenesis protein CcdA [Candidatus Omnitrophota bacterium]MDD5310141.1 cytochrome c biogenesis protein CcdA [Candidatus Omnitrophota bacterium]MDD5546282.1 cytochrome c biogenesis protein CcdA [Candidatus Omnitrophota bacterium]
MDSGTGSVSFIAAFVAGLLSFLSPCVLPLIPFYISYITGITFGELTQETLPKKIRFLTAVHSLLFILGFTIVFMLLGLSLTFAGGLVSQHRQAISKIGGIIIIIFGLSISGVINLAFLQKEKKVEVKSRPVGYLGSLLIGATFALGWTPCVGPLLASILLLSSTEKEIMKGAALLFSYSLGLALPFFISSILINDFLSYFKALKKYLRAVSVITGIFLVVVGIMLFTNSFGSLAGWFERLFSRP